MNLDEFIGEINQRVAPHTKFSVEYLRDIKQHTAHFVELLCKLSLEESHGKEVVDTDALKAGLNKIEFAKTFQLRTLNTTEVSQERPIPEEEVQQENKLSLYKQNKGHSHLVESCIKSYPTGVSFVACLGQAVILRRILESIKDSCSQTEINFECFEDRINLQALGPSHISLLSLELRASGFESYTCNSPCTLGINVSGLTSFLKQATKNDQLTILHCTQDSRECVFVLEDGQRASLFEMKLKKMESHPLEITDVSYSSEWTMSSVSLQRVCRDLKSCMNSENVHINVTKEADLGPKLSFKGSGRYGTIRVDCDDMAKCLKFATSSELCFSHPYLNSFTKATPLSPQVTLKMGAETPLMVAYEIENIGYLHFYLAPKVPDSLVEKY